MYPNDATKSIIDHLTISGYKWSKDLNTERVLTYSYLHGENDPIYPRIVNQATGFKQLISFTSEDKLMTESILDEIAKSTGLEFHLAEGNERSNLIFSYFCAHADDDIKKKEGEKGSYLAGVAFFPYKEASVLWCSTIWIRKNGTLNNDINKSVLIHEILHALGLEHFDNDQDKSYTGVMRPVVLKIEEVPYIDLLALQRLYGDDKQIRTQPGSSNNNDNITKDRAVQKEQQRIIQEEQNRYRITQEKQEQYRIAHEDDNQATQQNNFIADAYTAAMVEYVANNVIRAGYRWNNNYELGKGIVFTYSYLQQGAFSAEQRAATEDILQKYVKCADIIFVFEENNLKADIMFGIFNSRYNPEDEEIVYFSASYYEQIPVLIADNVTDEDFAAILTHKLGHAMGLDHIDVPEGREDVYEYSIMSPWSLAIKDKLQPADELALQKLYGQPKNLSAKKIPPEELFKGFIPIDDIYTEVLYSDKSPADVIMDAHQQFNNNTVIVDIVGQQYEDVNVMA